MSLPILPSRPAASTADLIRFYYRTDFQWCQQIAEQAQLEVGTALVNPSLPDIPQANVVFDAAVPDGISPADAIAEADAHFAANGSRVLTWVANPSAPAQQTTPLTDHLLASGFVRRTEDIMHLSGQPTGAVREIGGLRVIPARASFRHAHELAREAGAGFASIVDQIADAFIAHLEDPQTDGLLALRDGMPAAYATVLTVGEMGCITQLFVSATLRRQGIGRTMMSRALEICARSLFKHVFLSCDPTNAGAIALYRQLGFEKVGDFVCYVREG
jgi:ribosomal protein S18 acetylase RimI-like enzyme